MLFYYIFRLIKIYDMAITVKNAFYPDFMLCKVCSKEKLEVVFLQCHHFVSCIQCAVTQNFCIICKLPISNILRVFLCMILSKTEMDIDQLKLESNKNFSATLCKVCYKNEISVVLLPCKHVHSCYKCATKRNDCPECKIKYFALLEVHF